MGQIFVNQALSDALARSERKGRHYSDVAGDLELREAFAEPSMELRLRGIGIRSKEDMKQHFLLTDSRRDTNDCGLLNVLMEEEGRLDLPRRDVLAANPDRVIVSTMERETVVPLELANVPGRPPLRVVIR